MLFQGCKEIFVFFSSGILVNFTMHVLQYEKTKPAIEIEFTLTTPKRVNIRIGVLVQVSFHFKIKYSYSYKLLVLRIFLSLSPPTSSTISYSFMGPYPFHDPICLKRPYVRKHLPWSFAVQHLQQPVHVSLGP